MYDCPVQGIVDFGDGPVILRCTEIGSHNEHYCIIPLTNISREDEVPVKHNNIFEQENN